MTRPRSAALASGLAAAGLASSAATVALMLVAWARGLDVELSAYELGAISAGVAYPTIGWIVARRRRENPIGWIYLVIGLSQAFNVLTGAYGTIGSRGVSLPLAPEAGWLALWTWGPGYVLMLTLAVLLFPDGRLPSPRWRAIVVLSAVSLGLMTLPWAIATWPHRANPALFDETSGALPGVELAFQLQMLGLSLAGIAATASIAGLVQRFRRSTGIERRQLKWFTFCGMISIAALATVPFVVVVIPDIRWVVIFGAPLIAPLVPLGAGIAILRYRLYEIDRIVSRTLSWAILSTVLLGLFAVSVVAVQAVLVGVTQGQTLAVAASTLLAAALFQPLRRRLQHLLDRRFDRGRYDAEQTMELFAERIRNEVDLGKLRADVEATAEQSLRPLAVGLWFRATGRTGR